MEEAQIKGNAAIAGSGTAGTGRRSVRKALLTPAVCSVCATFGIFGGIASLFVGIVFVVLHTLVTNDRMFDHLGTGLLIVAIPMILLGSIFLDEIEITK
jgi:hypothetical protein